MSFPLKLAIVSMWLVGFDPAPLNAQGYDTRPPASGGAQRPTVQQTETFRNRTNAPTTIAPAKRPITSPSESGSNETRSYGSPWTALSALGVVIALIVVSAYILKRHGPMARLGLPTEAVEILGKRSIDQRQTIHLVRLGSRILVLGTSPTGLRTLAEVVDPVEVDYLAGVCRRPHDERSFAKSFGALFLNQSRTRPSSMQDFDSTDQPQAEQELARRLRQAASSTARRPSRELRDERPAA